MTASVESIALLEMAQKTTDMKGTVKPGLENGANSLRSNVKWGQSATDQVVDTDKLK